MDKARLIGTAKYSGTSNVLGGAFVVIFAWVLNEFAKITMPNEVVIALTTLTVFFINILLAQSKVISTEE